MTFFRSIKNFSKPNVVKLNSLYIAKTDRNPSHESLSAESGEINYREKSLRSGLKFLIAVLILLIDQLTKLLVVNSMELGECHAVSPFFNIVFVKNTGITFGIFL